MPKGRTGLILILALLLLLPACGSKQVKAAREFMDAGMYQEALPLLELEIQSDPRNAEAHFLAGRCYLGMGQLARAKEPFERAILVDTDYREKVAEVLVEAGLAALEKESPGRAFSYLEVAAEYDPQGGEDLAAELRGRGRELAETSPDTGPAMALLDKSLDLDPASREKVSEIYFDAGETLIDKGFGEAGFAYAEKSINLDPGHIEDVAELYFEFGRESADRPGSDAVVITSLERSLQLDPERRSKIATVYHDLASSRRDAGDLSGAWRFARKSKDLNPDHASLLVQIEEERRAAGLSEVTVQGLVAYYPFDGTAQDLAGGNHGVPHGPIPTADRFGNPDQAFYFDGRDDFVEIPPGPGISLDRESFSISLWFRLDELRRYHCFVGRGVAAKGNQLLHVGIRGNHHWMFAMFGDGVGAPGSPEQGKWQHFVGTVDIDNQLATLYIDGERIAEDRSKGLIQTDSIPILIGMRGEPRSPYFTKGALDDIAIFDKALDADEVRTLYAQR